MEKLNLTISSDIENLKLVENFLDTLIKEFKLETELFGKVTLAAIEAINNACYWGGQNDSQKKVVIETWIENNQVFISIEDEGEGFDYTLIPDPTVPQNIKKENRRGLYLMKTLSDNLEFQNNGSKVIMSFFLNS